MLSVFIIKSLSVFIGKYLSEDEKMSLTRTYSVSGNRKSYFGHQNLNFSDYMDGGKKLFIFFIIFFMGEKYLFHGGSLANVH